MARVALTRLAEPGDPRIAQHVASLGAVGLVESLTRRHASTSKVGEDVLPRMEDLKPERDLERASRMGIRFIIPGDDEWPTQLDDLDHCGPVNGRAGTPLGLWAKGPLRLDGVWPAVAVVGSRSATAYGTSVAGEISAHLAEKQLTVVSGAAFGIDQAAHRGALAVGGGTVAVLACGVDRAYPAAHAKLLSHIGEHGVVVSEVPPGCAPTRFRFLSRNRVIAALSTGGVVVEAAIRSGSAEHRQLGELAQSAADGSARGGDECAVPGRTPADPQRRRDARHAGSRSARAAQSSRRGPVRGAQGSRAGTRPSTPARRPGSRRRTRCPASDGRVHRAYGGSWGGGGQSST